ncbi:MAG TPA: hypothetical protein VN372_02285 [Methanospirillum sp.]|nr:hypothetical protein [Methanospirillum sp.]
MVLISAMVLDPDWIPYPVLGCMYLVIWRFNPILPFGKIIQLIIGQVASIAVWNVLPWMSVIVQISIIGIFLQQYKTPVTHREVFWFSIYSAMVLISVFFLDNSHHVLIPGIVILGGGAFVVFYGFVSEYRLAREFRSDL